MASAPGPQNLFAGFDDLPLEEQMERLKRHAEQSTSATATRQVAAPSSQPPKAAARPASRRPQTIPIPSSRNELGQQVLPFWSDERIPSIHEWARSALFTGAYTAERRQIDGVLESSAYFTLAYKGEELRQKDLDLMLALLSMARGQHLDKWIRFRRKDLLRQLGWSTGARGYDAIEEVMKRLQACSVQIETKASGAVTAKYFGNIVAEYYAVDVNGDENQQMSAVRLNRRITQLMQPGEYSCYLASAREGLGPLSKWLLGFLVTHRAEMLERNPMSVQRYNELSGCHHNRLRAFREQLRKSLGELQSRDLVHDWTIGKDDRVRVTLNEAVRTRVTSQTTEALSATH